MELKKTDLETLSVLAKLARDVAGAGQALEMLAESLENALETLAEQRGCTGADIYALLRVASQVAQ